MNKILSIGFIFFSFFFFFLVVNFLTTIPDNKPTSIKNEIEEINVNFLPKETNIIEITDELNLENNKTTNTESFSIQKKEMKKDSNLKVENKGSKIINFYYIQFGAYSNKKGTDEPKKKIIEKLKKKYANFKLQTIFDSNKKVFQLVFKSQNSKKAKEICDYSRSINIECYVRKAL